MDAPPPPLSPELFCSLLAEAPPMVDVAAFTRAIERNRGRTPDAVTLAASVVENFAGGPAARGRAWGNAFRVLGGRPPDVLAGVLAGLRAAWPEPDRLQADYLALAEAAIELAGARESLPPKVFSLIAWLLDPASPPAWHPQFASALRGWTGTLAELVAALPQVRDLRHTVALVGPRLNATTRRLRAEA